MPAGICLCFGAINCFFWVERGDDAWLARWLVCSTGGRWTGISSMTESRMRPLWLSVPAAAVRSGFEAALSGHCRLLKVSGDLECSIGSSAQDPGWDEGWDEGWVAIPVRESGLECQLRRALGCAGISVGPLSTGVVLELGRCSAHRGDAEVQRVERASGPADTGFAAAMTVHQLDRALSAGRQAVERAKLDGVELVAVGSAGIGTGATNRAWGAWLAEETATIGSCGSHDGWKPMQRQRRTRCRVSDAIPAQHADASKDPYTALRYLGGFEHAALVGAMLSAAQLGLPLLSLGSSASVAARLAVRLNGSIEPWVHREAFRARLEVDPGSPFPRRRRKGAGLTPSLCSG